MSSTLYLARLLEVSPSGRVVVECVTTHPDAGMPPTGEADERRFVARLLEDAHERSDLDDAHERSDLDDAVDRRVTAGRRIRTIDIEFDDEFWQRHRDEWWAVEPVVAGETLRDWLSGPSDGSPYQVVAFEAQVDPEFLRGLRPHTFGSTAYW